jgi:GNAT superfamily N-acetyltransferase
MINGLFWFNLTAHLFFMVTGQMENINFFVRNMLTTDCVEVAILCNDLGYSASPAQIDTRLEVVMSRPDNHIFVVEVDGRVCGWCHVLGVRLIETDGYAEIGGIVVAPSMQRCGLGTALIKASEVWSSHKNYLRLRLRSGVHREEAHKFYESIGYTKSRASYAFEKYLVT